MKSLNLNQTKQTFLVSLVTGFFPAVVGIILLLIAASAYYFSFIPQLNRFGSGGDLNLISKQAEVTAHQEYLLKLRKLKSNFEIFQSDDNYRKFLFALPGDPASPALFIQLDAIAQVNGVQLQRVDVVPSLDSTVSSQPVQDTSSGLVTRLPVGVKRVSVTLTLGRLEYTSFKNFMAELEKNIRLLDVVSFSFDPRAGSQTINLAAYYYKE